VNSGASVSSSQPGAINRANGGTTTSSQPGAINNNTSNNNPANNNPANNNPAYNTTHPGNPPTASNGLSTLPYNSTNVPQNIK
jgi:hypothetical protein